SYNRSMPTPILATKLYIPPPRPNVVLRPHLLERLNKGLRQNQGFGRKLTLISAPAGFGKTTLVSAWVAGFERPAAWLSLDEGDNDPARFFSYVVAAIQMQRPNFASALLAALQSATPPAPLAAAQALINPLANAAAPLILVLDDYHLIDNHALHDALAFLLDHLPTGVTLVLLSRADPPLPLGRLRASHGLLELRGDGLRFSGDETVQFLNQTMQLDLPTATIQALEKRTEGWIAGLQLAALALETLPDRHETFVAEFTGSHRFVLDYLLEEVLARQPEDVRRFLLHTSLLPRLNASLCNAVTGRTDSQSMIDHLERHNLFLLPLDQARHWYRYHHLFGTLLQTYLQAEAPTLIPTLHLRAAQWYEANALPEMAVDEALAAGAYDYAAALLTGPAMGVTQRGEVTTLLNWYRAFPHAVVSRHPALCLHFGLAFALGGRWDEAEALVNAVADVALPDPLAIQRLLVMMLNVSASQDTERLAQIAEQAQVMIAASTTRDPPSLIGLGLVADALGNLDDACRLMADARALAERDGAAGLALTVLFHQSLLHVWRGDLHLTQTLCQEALAAVNHDVGALMPLASIAYSALTRIAIEWNEPERAVEAAHQALQMAEQSGLVAGVMSTSLMMLAEARHGLGDDEGALQAAEDSLDHAQRYDSPLIAFYLSGYRARLWLAQGQIAPAVAWLRETGDRPVVASMFVKWRIVEVTRARTLLARRKIEAAIARLTRLAAAPRDIFTVEALALLASARQMQGDATSALTTLEQSLELARPEKRIRIFLDLGAPMRKLLEAYAEQQHAEDAFVQTLIGQFPVDGDQSLPDALSERELDVLRLIAAGHTNGEIAAALVIAPSTVKWYVNTIYGKLHVKTRGQAIARAHELRLIDP
ncbi:MAG: AAA family ATPase, partial [Anaerolineae bacterium]|nr:AAA family ATPase [Anaerolineae bacterium]